MNEVNDKHNLVITRVFDAPLTKVWQAWTDPAKLQQWWGPRGVSNPTCEWDARPGGKINVVMLAGKELGELAGQEWPTVGEFKEVVANQMLVYSAAALVNGQPVMEQTNTVSFEEQEGKTKMTLSIVVDSVTPEAEGPLAGMEMGWNQSLDKLSKSLS